LPAADGQTLTIAERATGGERLLPGISGQARAPAAASWSPDGSRLAYLADGECATVLAVYVAAANGDQARRLTNPCRRVGTPRHDALSGSAGADAIFGRGGRDRLDGASGPDYLDGGGDNDAIDGDGGDDRLVGGGGRDRLVGGRGWDRIDARDRARDLVSCGRGRDGVVADRLDRVARDCEVVERA
jgi:hypothetical protein